MTSSLSKEDSQCLTNKPFCEKKGCTPCMTCLNCVYEVECDETDHTWCNHPSCEYKHCVPKSYFDAFGGILLWKESRDFFYECTKCLNQRQLDLYLRDYWRQK
jgi:hypothetical protein